MSEALLPCPRRSCQRCTYASKTARRLICYMTVGAISAAVQAQAYLFLSQLGRPAQQAPVHMGVASGIAPPLAVPTAGLPSDSQCMSTTEELLQSSLSVVPPHSASAVHAWRLYGDWLYGQPDTPAIAEAARHPSKLKAANAYCRMARNAAGILQPASTMSALLRVLQVSSPWCFKRIRMTPVHLCSRETKSPADLVASLTIHV